ncbi:MAG: hypothetical protein H0V19_10550 [Euzebyales bacterium]|nr:hypothetical protein [Euzebyales bacterium]
MTIPRFNDAGNLPPGRHTATQDEIRAQLVDGFATSRTRSAIYEYWHHHLLALLDLAQIHHQWLAGSFTSDKPDPNDVDIVTVLDGPAFDDLPRHRQLMVRMLIDGHYTEDFWNCDAYPVLAYPQGTVGHNKYLVALERWEDYFGHDRNGDERGFLQVDP